MGDRRALIIANTEYMDRGLDQLRAPGKDAEDFARVLRDTGLCAFDDVTVLLNQLSSSAIEAVDGFFDNRKPDDLLVLYFSGHGIRDEYGSLYLAFVNTVRSRLRSTAIKADYIREAMDQSRSKRQVVFLDCCNSGAFPQGSKAELGGAMGMVQSLQGYGRFVLTASDSTQFAWEGDQLIGETDNSLFTHFLVKGLEGEADRDGDGTITVDELYDYAFEQISKITPKQTPTKSASRQEGEIVLRQITRLKDIRKVPLPPDLTSEIKDYRPYLRAVAVEKLERILNGRHLGLALAAREALEKMAGADDSLQVRKAAAEAIAAADAKERAKAEGEPPPPAEVGEAGSDDIGSAFRASQANLPDAEIPKPAAIVKVPPVSASRGAQVPPVRSLEAAAEVPATPRHEPEWAAQVPPTPAEPQPKRARGGMLIWILGGIGACFLLVCGIGAGLSILPGFFPPAVPFPTDLPFPTEIFSETPTQLPTEVPTDIPTETQEPMQLIFGPQDGSLIHDANDDLISADLIGADLRDFLVSAMFWNPYSASVGSWTYGFVFREEGFNKHYRLVVSSDATWRLENVADTFTLIQGGRLPNLDISEGGANTIEVFVSGNSGQLRVNEEAIAELDLSTRQNSGNVGVATGFVSGSETDGYNTAYEGLSIWVTNATPAPPLVPTTRPTDPPTPMLTAGSSMFCREGPSASYDAPWQLNSGETVPVIGVWNQDWSWILVDINSPSTRTDCCWVSGLNTVNVPLSALKSINTIPDRLDCSSVR